MRNENKAPRALQLYVSDINLEPSFQMHVMQNIA